MSRGSADRYLRDMPLMVRLDHKRAAGLPEADGHVGAESLAQREHRLEVAQVEGHVAGGVRAVLVAQEHLVRVHGQLRVQRVLRAVCAGCPTVVRRCRLRAELCTRVRACCCRKRKKKSLQPSNPNWVA